MAIQNPNSSGQGFDPFARNNLAHVDILSFGYEYSHSVPVMHGDMGRLIHHCYKRGEHNVSVWDRGMGIFSTVNWTTSTSCASGRHTRGYDVLSLRKHLKNKSRRYPGLRVKR